MGNALRAIRLFCILAPSAGILTWAQDSSSFESKAAGSGVSDSAATPDFNTGPSPAPAQILPADELDNLVAPIALYPDQLLSQVLAASTYPLEVVEAQQWIRNNENLRGSKLAEAAKQQSWDPSIQALLVQFPEAMDLLSRDVQWTTELGNAFLAQEPNVMESIQRLRLRAQNNGQLDSTPEEIVATEEQADGQRAIEIQPADPQKAYVPSYDPQDVWGPPAQGDYPDLGYDGRSRDSYQGQTYGAAVNPSPYFIGSGGLLGWGGWSWGINWGAGSVIVNGYPYVGGCGGRQVWVHDPDHRRGVPYSNYVVASRFGGAFRPELSASVSRYDAPLDGRSHEGSSGWHRPGGECTGDRQTTNVDRTFKGDRGYNGGRSYNGDRSYNGERGYNGDRSYNGDRLRGRTEGHAQVGGESRGFSNSDRGPSNGWHSAGRDRSFEGSSERSRSEGGRGSGLSSGLAGEYRSRGDERSGYRSNEHPDGAMRYSGSAESYGRGSGAGYGRGSSSDRQRDSQARSPFRSTDRSFARNEHFADGRSSQRFSGPRESSQHYSAPRMESHSSGGERSGGHSSGGHSSGGHSSGGHSSGGRSHSH